MIDFKKISLSEDCFSLCAAYYQRFKGLTEFSALKTLVDAPGDDIYLRLGHTHSTRLRTSKNAICDVITEDLNYVSGYMIRANNDRSFCIYMHSSLNGQTRWIIPFEFLSPIIFIYYSLNNDVTFERIVDDLCSSKIMYH